MEHNQIQIKTAEDQDVFVNTWKGDKEPVANIVIVHGMAEYSYRYNDFAVYLTSLGFDVYAEDHLGHGLAVSKRKNPIYGYGVWPEDGFENSVGQVHSLVEYIHSISDKPVMVFGHSLGSFITTRFYEEHSGEVKALVICGSAFNNFTYKSSSILTSVMKIFKGKKAKKKPSHFLTGLSNKSMNKKSVPFKDGYTSNNLWLSYNEENVRKYDADKECGFECSFMFFYSMFKGQQQAWKKSSLTNIKTPKDLLIISGHDDPVGNYGKDVENLYKFFKAFQPNVRFKLYDNMKHEILNETDHLKVYKDIGEFFLNEIK